jgi:uncharacterized damage-inducible protein DinB
MVTEWMFGIINGFSDEDLKLSPSPGKNHAQWILGHLVASDDDLSVFLGKGELLFPEYAELFSQGRKLIPPELCPPASEMRIALTKVTEKNKAIFASLRDEELDEPHALMKDPENDYFKTKRRVIMAWHLHQIYHTGQLALILSIAGKNIYG